MEINDGGPVYPVNTVTSDASGAIAGIANVHSGMSLRDWFAGQALAALILKVPLHDRKGELGIHAEQIAEIHQVRLDIAESARDYADAMIATLAAKAPPASSGEGGET